MRLSGAALAVGNTRTSLSGSNSEDAGSHCTKRHVPSAQNNQHIKYTEQRKRTRRRVGLLDLLIQPLTCGNNNGSRGSSTVIFSSYFRLGWYIIDTVTLLPGIKATT